MKKVTLEDVNEIILETDIKIIDSIEITNLNDLKHISPHLFGVYVINLKYNESYIGMSKRGMRRDIIRGIKSRLLSHSHENWHKSIIKSINIFVTDREHSFLLEKMMIKIFNPELNNIKYDNFNFVYDQKQLEFDDNTHINLSNEDNKNEEDDDGALVIDYEYDSKYKYETKYGNYKFINWLKKQKNRHDEIGDMSIDLLHDSKENGIMFKNIFVLMSYLKSVDFNMDLLDTAYNEYKYIHTTDYKKQTENFGVILIDSLNPKLSEQLTNNKSFGFNYRLLCKKYDEIRTIKDKNVSNLFEESVHKKKENDNILENDINYRDEYMKNRQDIYKIRKEKIKIIKRNYAILLSELSNELEKLYKKYGKDEDYTINSDYHFKIKDDIVFYIKFDNPELLIKNQEMSISNTNQ